MWICPMHSHFNPKRVIISQNPSHEFKPKSENSSLDKLEADVNGAYQVDGHLTWTTSSK